MSDESLIEWTDATWLPWPGCMPKSAGCLHCYAMKDGWRLAYNPNAKVRAAYRHIIKKVIPTRTAPDGTIIPGIEILGGDEHPRRHEDGVLKFTGITRFLPGKLSMPLRWRKARRIFVSANSDLFLPPRLEEPDKIAAVFGVMAAAKRHTFQVLTKWPENAAKWFSDLSQRVEGFEDAAAESVICMRRAGSIAFDRNVTTHVPASARALLNPAVAPPWPLSNVWLGASVENKATKSRIDDLRKINVAVRFLSIEPLLEDLGDLDLTGIGWVIVGGESGGLARSCWMEWIEAIVEQCQRAKVPVFVKQLGADPRTNGGNLVQIRSRKGGDMDEWPERLRIREMPGAFAA